MWEGIFNECHYEARGSNIRDILAKSLDLISFAFPMPPAACFGSANQMGERWRTKTIINSLTYPFIHSPPREFPRHTKSSSRVTLAVIQLTLQDTAYNKHQSLRANTIHPDAQLFRTTRRPHRANIYRTTSALASRIDIGHLGQSPGSGCEHNRD
jgi:hypothetical protein